MSPRKPILSLDFDGCIHSYTSGWKGAHVIPDPPVPGAIPYLLSALDHFTVAIHSSRSKNPLGRFAMKRWLGKAIAEHWQSGGHELSLAECECWGDAAGIWQRFSWPWFKPAAIITIDDRALTFDGNWSSPRYSAETIKTFKPWNKRPKPQCLATLDPNTATGLICDLCEAKWPSREEFACLRSVQGW